MMKFFSVTVLAMTLLMVVPQGHAACTEQSLDATDSIFGQLSESDCPINELIGGLDESKADVFSLVIAATTTVSISMTSESFDAFLLVYNSDYSSVLAEDDDSGDNLDAVVEDLVLAPGTYHILANSSTQQAVFGSYTLSFVSEVAVDTVIVSSVLPSSRSVQVGSPATAFATIINASAVTATNCGLALRSSIDADFSYQTTNPATNQSVGSADTPADIGAGLYQSYIFTITPNSAFPPQEVELDYRCLNSLSAATVVGLNTLLLSGNNTSVPDVVALVATPVDPGVINLPDTNGVGFDVFSVASVNVGGAGDIIVSVDTGSADIDVTILLCQTNPLTAACINPEVPSSSPVELNIASGETPTFAFFVAGNEVVSFDPANNRLFIRFHDLFNLTRGATSVAVRTAQ